MTDYFLESHGYDRSCWLWVPTLWPMPGDEKKYPDAATWADWAAKVLWREHPVKPRRGEVKLLARILTRVSERTFHSHPGFEVFLHLPGVQAEPLPVYFGDVELPEGSDPDEQLRLATGADDPDAVERPVMEEFTTAHLGTGWRVLRYTKDAGDPPGITAVLRYAWFNEQLGRIVVLFTAHPRPERLVGVMDDIERFVGSLRYVPDGNL